MDLEAIRNTLQKTLSTANNILHGAEHPGLIDMTITDTVTSRGSGHVLTQYCGIIPLGAGDIRLKLEFEEPKQSPRQEWVWIYNQTGTFCQIPETDFLKRLIMSFRTIFPAATLASRQSHSLLCILCKLKPGSVGTAKTRHPSIHKGRIAGAGDFRARIFLQSQLSCV